MASAGPTPKLPTLTLTEPITCPAPAKVNLTLAVGPPSPPKGYHPIDSLFACIDLADEVTLIPDPAHPPWPATPVYLERAWQPDAPKPSPIDWPAEKDLALRALHLVLPALNLEHAVSLRIDKRIPTGGGLGGGSADAGAVLRIAAHLRPELHATASGQAELIKLAMSLGSDVAFFADVARASEHKTARPVQVHPPGLSLPPRPALVQGFGERLTRVTPTRGWLVLLIPPVACPTPAVYKAFDASGPLMLDTARTQRAIAAMASGGPTTGAQIDPQLLFNDLAEPAMVVAPMLREITRAVEAATALVCQRHQWTPATARVHVSGSGSTMFLAAGTRDQAEALAAAASTTLGQLAGEARQTVLRTVRLL